MKNSSKFKLIILILIILIAFIFPTNTGADSGWDGGYDSGSSSDWSSSSSDWSSSDWSSSSGGSHSGNGTTVDDIAAILIFFIIVMMYLIYKNPTATPGINNEYSVDIEKIKTILPDFDYPIFKQQAYEIYKKIQIAWMNFDYDTLKKYCSNELYNLYKSQLEVLKLKNQQNVMENFSLIDFCIKDMECNNDTISLKVLANISCNDYVIDCSNNNVLRGTKSKKVCYFYEMTFIKSIKNEQNICPNCHAPLENQQTNICSYCRSTIISENYDWVLSKKEVKNQYYI